MTGETSPTTLLRNMSPQLNARGFHHDHLFVGPANAEPAPQVLRQLAANAE